MTAMPLASAMLSSPMGGCGRKETGGGEERTPRRENRVDGNSWGNEAKGEEDPASPRSGANGERGSSECRGGGARCRGNTPSSYVPTEELFKQSTFSGRGGGISRDRNIFKFPILPPPRRSSRQPSDCHHRRHPPPALRHTVTDICIYVEGTSFRAPATNVVFCYSTSISPTRGPPCPRVLIYLLLGSRTPFTVHAHDRGSPLFFIRIL